MFVLVVTRQAAIGELVRQALGAEGWWVTAVADRETAVRSASDQAPELVVIDGSVNEADELVRFFASRHGGPGALLLASDGEVGAACVEDADAVLPHEPEIEKLTTAAQRLLEEPQASTAELPTPGQVLNAQDIFGEMLAEIDEVADDRPAPPTPAEDETVGTEADPFPAEMETLVEETETAGETALPVEIRAMVIPEPTMEEVDDDLDFALPSFDESVVPEVQEVGGGIATVPVPVVPEVEAGTGRELETENEPAGVEDLAIEDDESEPAAPEVTAVPQPVLPAAVAGSSFRDRLAGIAQKLRGAGGTETAAVAEIELESGSVSEAELEPGPGIEPAPQAAAAEPAVFADAEVVPDEPPTEPQQEEPQPEELELDEHPEPEMEPEPEMMVEPFPVAEAFPAVEPIVVAEPARVPETEVVAELGAAARLEAAPDLGVFAGPRAVPEPQAVPEPEPQAVLEPEPQVVLEPEPQVVLEPEPQVVPEPEIVPEPDEAAGPPREQEPEEDPVPPKEEAAIARPQVAPAATAFWRRGSLPGGVPFWLGMAAGLLVFVVASFFLDRFFSSAPAEPPAAVAAPAVDAADLEELVNQEMAQREAELRESLLEEERRLQQQLDELTNGDDG